MIKDPRISIALCTHNGERYLKDQLDSYLKQTLQPYELVACDDASLDSTLALLENFSKKAPFPVRIYKNEHKIGLIKNFSQAADLCSGDYVAFSDQDDIWLPDKLKISYQVMKTAENTYGSNTHILVHSDLCLIDDQNHVITTSYMKVKNWKHNNKDPLRTLLMQNYVAGCTTLCNKSLIEKSLPFPDVLTNHDGWVALITASTGKILFINDATILYRQHGSNVTGRATPNISITGIMKTTIHAIKKSRLNPDWGIKNSLSLYNQAQKLKKRLMDLECDIPPCLESFIHTMQTGGIIRTLDLMVRIKVRQPGFLLNLFYFYIIARGFHIPLLKDNTSYNDLS